MPQPTWDHKELTIAHVAMGSNATSSIGSPEKTLRAAKEAISCDSVKLLAESRFYRTPAVPTGSGPDYVNAVLAVHTRLDSDALLAHLHAIEEAFGRVRDVRWGARAIDLDLISFGGAVLPDAATHATWRDLPFEAQKTQAPDRLIVPHPRMQDRAFVLIPLADVAPDWVHPVTGLSVSAMLDALPEDEKAAIKAI